MTTFIQDPTLPRSYDRICQHCKEKGCLYFQLPERVADDAMTLVYMCLNPQCCAHVIEGRRVANEDDDEG